MSESKPTSTTNSAGNRTESAVRRALLKQIRVNNAGRDYSERTKVFPTEHPFAENKDGSVSNVILSGEDVMNEAGMYDHTVAFPTMVGGVKYTKDEAYHIAKGEGLENYPKFKSVKEMNQWAEENHGNIDEKGFLFKPKKPMVNTLSEATNKRPPYIK